MSQLTSDAKFRKSQTVKMGEVPCSVKENAQWGEMMVVRMVFSLFRAEEELADLYNYYFQEAVAKRGLRDPNDPR